MALSTQHLPPLPVPSTPFPPLILLSPLLATVPSTSPLNALPLPTSPRGASDGVRGRINCVSPSVRCGVKGEGKLLWHIRMLSGSLHGSLSSSVPHPCCPVSLPPDLLLHSLLSLSVPLFCSVPLVCFHASPFSVRTLHTPFPTPCILHHPYLTSRIPPFLLPLLLILLLYPILILILTLLPIPFLPPFLIIPLPHCVPHPFSLVSPYLPQSYFSPFHHHHRQLLFTLTPPPLPPPLVCSCCVTPLRGIAGQKRERERTRERDEGVKGKEGNDLTEHATGCYFSVARAGLHWTGKSTQGG